MSIEVTCPNGHWLKIKQKYAGMEGMCPICHASIRVPITDTIFDDDAIMGVLKPHESGLSIVTHEEVEPEPEPAKAWPPARENYGDLMPIPKGRPIPLTRGVMRVGRCQSCDIVLAATTVSREHAELRIVEGRWHVKDQGSTNGTKVNGDRVNQAELHSGDVIGFGLEKYMIVFSATALGAVGTAKSDAHQRSANGDARRTQRLPKLARAWA